MQCVACQIEKVVISKKTGKERLPSGWKRIGNAVHCSDCTHGRYALRALTIPIRGPVRWAQGARSEPRNLGWPEFREMLRDAWIATTQTSNFVMRQLALADPGIVDGKIQKMPRVYCYPEIRKRWPTLPTSAVNCLEQAVQGRYRKLRKDLLTYRMSLPTMRYPVPMPIHNATWRTWEEPGGQLMLSFQLGEGRVTVELRGGRNYLRQRLGVRRIIGGEAIQGELSIYRIKANPSDHRNGDTPATRVVAKMVAWFPKDQTKPGSVFGMHTGGDAFLSLLQNDEQVFRWNADHVRRRIRRHDDELQRLREDLKAEKLIGRERDGILARMDLVSQNQRAYLHSFCHEVSAQVVNLIRRRRGTMLAYVDVDQGYMPHFPWAKLRGMLADKADKAGIEMTSGPAASESPESLEVETEK